MWDLLHCFGGGGLEQPRKARRATHGSARMQRYDRGAALIWVRTDTPTSHQNFGGRSDMSDGEQ